MATGTEIVALLKDCAKQKDLCRGARVHADILKRRLLDNNCYIGSSLVNMYAKCGALAKAAQLLKELPVRDVVSWSALIAGYAQHGDGEEALDCFNRMQHEGLSPNIVTYICILKACGSVKAADKGEQIHAEIVRKGLLEKDVVLGNTLVDMYAKCGALSKAAEVMDDLPVRNVVTWNALIAGYAQLGQGEEALKCFERMYCEGLSPDTVTFSSILKACGSKGAVGKGEEIHKEIERRGLLGTDIILGNALVDMYAKCGALAKAARVFDELPVRDVVSWSALIAGYAQQGKGEEALTCFKQMQREGLFPNTVTLICTLKACGSIGSAYKGKQIHDEIVRRGLLGKDIVIGTTLVDMYAKCGALVKAAQVLDELPIRNVVSWNALIAGYAQQGQGEEAVKCYGRMQSEGLAPDRVTFICILKACGNIGAADKGEQVHDEIVRRGLLGKDVLLGNTLINMYAKCGALAKAVRVLDELPVRDVVSWSALIAAYAQQQQSEEALKCLERMHCEGFSPNVVTFVCILKAYGSSGAADKGEEIHNEIVRQGLLVNHIVLGTTLVDMYAKCGALGKAARAFDELPVRNVVSWNALIAGYAQQGQGEDALICFECMQREGLCPDAVTLVCVLNACSRSGLLVEGQTYYDEMSTKYGITPNVEHHTCMVDLFGRVGDFEGALAVIKQMPNSGYLPVWHALLGACQEGENVKLGRFAFKNAVQIDKYDSAAYVLMMNIYAAAGMHKDAYNIQTLREISMVEARI